MTREQIIRMARDADLVPSWMQDIPEYQLKWIEDFAALVAEVERKAEREACINIAKQWDADHPTSNYGACIARRISARDQT